MKVLNNRSYLLRNQRGNLVRRNRADLILVNEKSDESSDPYEPL